MVLSLVTRARADVGARRRAYHPRLVEDAVAQR